MLKRVWQEIKKGENIDLYVTIFAAVLVAVLNLFNLAQGFLASITLAVLALLAFSILGNRYKLERLLEEKNESSRTLLLKKFPETLEVDLSDSKELWIVGTNLARTIPTYYSLIERKLSRGDKIRILVTEPNSLSSTLASKRMYQPVSAERNNDLINSTLQLVCNLKKIASAKLEIRTLDHMFAFGCFAMNPESSNGVIYLQNYYFKNKEGDIPKMVLRPQDEDWYQLFVSQIHILWEHASRWECHNSVIEPAINDEDNNNQDAI